MTDNAEILDLLHALRDEVAQLRERISALEAGDVSQSHTSRPPASNETLPQLDEELVAAIGAAIAGYLGKKAPIRQIRLIGSVDWARQGRVAIQGSHRRSGK